MKVNPEINITVKIVDSELEKNDCVRIRTQVFVLEQGVDPNHEIDDYDDKCVHAIALIGSEPVGTGRLIKLSSSKAQIGRMAVLHECRRLQIGTQILKKLEKHAHEMQITTLILHAQLYVRNFYENNGYTATGEVFLDENISHVLMTKQL